MSRDKLNARIVGIPMPDRMRALPISDEGYPVPKFVPYVDGKPEFRGMDGDHLVRCVRLKLCWLCGKPMGKYMSFVIGPMCAVNRISSEPPSHHACAEYAVRACPFLSQPRMRRNEKDMPEGDVAGIGIKRNPGVSLIWTTLDYRIKKVAGGVGVLFMVGDPLSMEYYSQGRMATREEVVESMEGGLPLLMNEAEKDGPDAVVELKKMYADALDLVWMHSAIPL